MRRAARNARETIAQATAAIRVSISVLQHIVIAKLYSNRALFTS